MPKKITRFHYLNGELYVSCPKCKQTLHSENFSITQYRRVDNDRIDKKIKSYCKGCTNALNLDRKNRAVKEAGIWMEVEETNYDEVLKKFHEINELPCNEFREFVKEKFAPETMIDTIEAVYRKLLEQ